MSVRLYKMSWIFELVITLLKPFFFCILFHLLLFFSVLYPTSLLFLYTSPLSAALCAMYCLLTCFSFVIITR